MQWSALFTIFGTGWTFPSFQNLATIPKLRDRSNSRAKTDANSGMHILSVLVVNVLITISCTVELLIGIEGRILKPAPRNKLFANRFVVKSAFCATDWASEPFDLIMGGSEGLIKLISMTWSQQALFERGRSELFAKNIIRIWASAYALFVNNLAFYR